MDISKLEEIREKSDEGKKLLEKIEKRLLTITDTEGKAKLKESADELRAALVLAEVAMMKAFAEKMMGMPIEFADPEEEEGHPGQE